MEATNSSKTIISPFTVRNFQKVGNDHFNLQSSSDLSPMSQTLRRSEICKMMASAQATKKEEYMNVSPRSHMQRNVSKALVNQKIQNLEYKKRVS